MTRCGSLLELIGNTPLVKITKLNPNPDVEIWAKLEGLNPGGSVKDRIALYMINEAEKAGVLSKDKIIVEPTSGNTGIGLAMIGAYKGYKVLLVMPKSVSMERRKILRAFGANLLLTPADEGVDGAIRKARELVKKSSKFVMLDQFRNPANVKAHYETTGPEIWDQTKGRVTHFVAGLGTTGTIMGVGRYLKERNPAIKIIGIEPHPGHKIQGLKSMKESIIPAIYNESFLDGKIYVDTEVAYDYARMLALEEGLFVGMSSGAAMYGAAELAKKLKKGVIVTIFPDMGFKYLSTKLYSCREIAKCKKNGSIR